MGDAILFRVFVLLYLFCSFLSIILRVTRLSISDPFANVSQIVNRLLSTTLWRNSSEKNPFLTSSKFLLWIWSSFQIFYFSSCSSSLLLTYAFYGWHHLLPHDSHKAWFQSDSLFSEADFWIYVHLKFPPSLESFHKRNPLLSLLSHVVLK